MDDLISRQAAINALCRRCDLAEEDDEPCTEKCNDIKILEKLPSAQPEIIRCKGCKWWSNDDYRECSNPNYDDGYVTPAGFYCGYAERRTDGRD